MAKSSFTSWIALGLGFVVGRCLPSYHWLSMNLKDKVTPEPSSTFHRVSVTSTTVTSNTKQEASTKLSLAELDQLRDKLLGPEDYAGPGCPPGCGCPNTPVDCPRHYNVRDIDSSAMTPLAADAATFVTQQLQARHQTSRDACTVQGSRLASNGGWCLGQYPKRGQVKLPNGKVIGKPSVYAGPSTRVCLELEALIQTENITSLTDFGAGYGPYGAYLVPKFPQLQYHAYDGAGDVEDLTGGFVKYVDLSLNLEKV